MTEKQVREIKKKFSTKAGGPLYSIFFEGRHYTPKEVLVSNEDILELLSVPYNNANSLEQEGITRLLCGAIAAIRKGARNRKQPWIDNTFEDSVRKIAYHGFSDDSNKAIACIARFKERAESARKIAQITERNLKTFYPQIVDTRKSA